MSNIFLSTSLITLAEMELGCDGDDEECGKIYGFKPSSLIAITATISGICRSPCMLDLVSNDFGFASESLLTHLCRFVANTCFLKTVLACGRELNFEASEQHVIDHSMIGESGGLGGVIKA